MKKIILFAAIAVFCTSCYQFDGPVITEDLDLQYFDAIRVEGYADILFTQADTFGGTLQAREGIIDRIDIRVDGTTLVIDTRKGNQFISLGTDKISLRLSAPCLKKINIEGAARFELTDGLVSDEDLKVRVDGAGKLDLAGVSLRDLDIEIDGAGQVYVDGDVDNALLEIDGAGQIDARYLEVFGELRKHISGVGEILL